MSRATCLATLADNGRVRARLMEKTGWREGDKPQRFVSVSFTADGIYKSLECRRAEDCGCRYMSHRTGYQFSVRAWNRYVVDLRERALEYPFYLEALEGMIEAPVAPKPARDRHGIGGNAPEPRVSRTGSRRRGWEWACGHIVDGETEIRVPMLGEPYSAPRRVEAYGSTRLRAMRAYAALIELR